MAAYTGLHGPCFTSHDRFNDSTFKERTMRRPSISDLTDRLPVLKNLLMRQAMG